MNKDKLQEFDFAPRKAVCQQLICVEQEVLEMALLQLDDGPPETKQYVAGRLQAALTPVVLATNGYSAVEAMALAGWDIKCMCWTNDQGVRWSMQRSSAPYEFGDDNTVWFGRDFAELIKIATDYNHGPVEKR
jgi:hypothetical protein